MTNAMGELGARPPERQTWPTPSAEKDVEAQLPPLPETPPAVTPQRSLMCEVFQRLEKLEHTSTFDLKSYSLASPLSAESAIGTARTSMRSMRTADTGDLKPQQEADSPRCRVSLISAACLSGSILLLLMSLSVLGQLEAIAQPLTTSLATLDVRVTLTTTGSAANSPPGPALAPQADMLHTSTGLRGRLLLEPCGDDKTGCVRVNSTALSSSGHRQLELKALVSDQGDAAHQAMRPPRWELDEPLISMRSARKIVAVSFAIAVVLLVVMVRLLVSGPVCRLSSALAQLQDFKLEQCALQLSGLRTGSRSHIREVHALESAAGRLLCSLDAFGRFVPRSIVRDIASGNEQCMQLHASHRHVTIMFSDVRDFTRLSTSLSPQDMLLMLTCYFSVMTRVVESCDGTVAEILGDGLLAYWNAPEDVPEHAAQACRAALAQHEALQRLNSDFTALGLPPLAIRIGIHTGVVLSGNLGSSTKMKFGCMGDAVNLCSRLEGLCKHYGVGTIISADTHAELPADYGFVARRLDTVMVKGRVEPTVIYELLGQDFEGEFSPSPMNPTAGETSLANRYEQALDAYQRGDFVAACALAKEVLQAQPDDQAAERLLQRAGECVGPEGEVLLSQDELASWTGVVKMDSK